MKNEKGFTLIEIVVSLVIVTLLFSMVASLVTTVNRFRKKTEVLQSCEVYSNTLFSSMSDYEKNVKRMDMKLYEYYLLILGDNSGKYFGDSPRYYQYEDQVLYLRLNSSFLPVEFDNEPDLQNPGFEYLSNISFQIVDSEIANENYITVLVELNLKKFTNSEILIKRSARIILPYEEVVSACYL